MKPPRPVHPPPPERSTAPRLPQHETHEGHLVACMTCALRLKGTCPICKDDIALVQKIYKA